MPVPLAIVHALDLAVYTSWTTGVNLASDAGVEYVTLERVGAGNSASLASRRSPGANSTPPKMSRADRWP